MDVTFLENQPYFQKNSLQGENLEEENFWDITTIPLPKTIDPCDTITTPITGPTLENENESLTPITGPTNMEDIRDPSPILPNMHEPSTGGDIPPNVSTEQDKELLTY